MSKKDTNLKALVAKNLVLRGYNKKDLAILLSMSPASLYNKLSNPDSFTFGELRKLKEVLRFTDEELLMVI